MTFRFLRSVLCAAAIGSGALCGPAQAADQAPCAVGAYRLDDGTILSIDPSDAPNLRWRTLDGRVGLLSPAGQGRWTSTFGWTKRADGVVVTMAGCDRSTLVFGKHRARPIPFSITETRFRSGDVTLAGRLVMPEGSGKVPLVVLVHGAERDSAREFNYLQHLLPAQGVAAFVWDKRSTGDSTGAYTQDFSVLANDVIAAMHEAKRLGGARVGRVGYQGGSQGGWVVPIAASREKVDFAIVSFGLAVSVIDEDQEEIALEMKLKGYDEATIAKAQEIGRAAEAVFESGFSSGFAQFDAIRAKYKAEPWYKDVHGNYTWFILPLTANQIRAEGPQFQWGTPWRYDPMPTLRALCVPELWVMGGLDLDAPSAHTNRLLHGLIADGRPITTALYPKSEHGMNEFEMGPNGERLGTRYPSGYFRMLADYARTGVLPGSYGAAEITRPRGNGC